MKQLTLYALLLLCPGLVLGQIGPNKPIQMDYGIYRGNSNDSPVLSLLPADTLVKPIPLTITVKPDAGTGLTKQQPTLVRTGLSLVIRFARTDSLPELSRYEIALAGQVRFKGYIRTNKDQVIPFPTPAGTTLSYIYSRFDALTGLISALTANTPTLASYASFTLSTSNSLASVNTKIASLSSTVGTLSSAVASNSVAIGAKAAQSSLDATNLTVAGLVTAMAGKLDASSYANDQAAISSALLTKISQVTAADRSTMLAVVPIAGTLIEIFVLSDSKYNNGPTKYNLLPNGDRYLTSFLITKDN